MKTKARVILRGLSRAKKLDRRMNGMFGNGLCTNSLREFKIRAHREERRETKGKLKAIVNEG